MLPAMTPGSLGVLSSAAAALQRLLPGLQAAVSPTPGASGPGRPPVGAASSQRSFFQAVAAAVAQTAATGTHPGAGTPGVPPPNAAPLNGLRPPLVHRAPRSEPIPEVLGHIHSTESFSAVDGPGIRCVVFLQGCAMRCSFCSNPDTWALHGGEVASSKEIAKQIRRILPYLQSSHGGLTCSGGEPLLQPQFVAALFQEAHAMGLSTTLDTTGQGTKNRNWDVVLPHTDGVLFCIKALDPEKYQSMTGLKQLGALRFAKELAERGIPFWARYVLIPGHTDSQRDMDLFTAWATQQPTLAGVELLPYHLYGKNKWDALGLQYPLAGVEPPPPGKVRAVVQQLEAAGLKVICEERGDAGPSLSAAHTGAHS